MTPELPPLPPLHQLTAEPPKAERLVKLARSGMRSYAHKLLREQGGLCPLCGKPIDMTIPKEGVLDHDHDDGRIRGVLHRSCNAAEGKIANAAARWGAKSGNYEAIIAYLERVVVYLKSPKTKMIYPTHKTVDEKREALNKVKRERNAAIKAKREVARRQRQEAE